MEFRRRTTPLICLVLGLVAFVAARLGDAHLHLCFDGQEPATAVHVADASVHHDAEHADANHQDRDIHVLDAAFVKKVGDEAPQLALLFAFLLFWPARRERPRRPPARTVAPFNRSPFRLRPPLRGPPLQRS